MPSASVSIWRTSAWWAVSVGTMPGYVGPSAITTSPGSTNTRHISSSTCWPPVVTSTCSGHGRHALALQQPADRRPRLEQALGRAVLQRLGARLLGDGGRQLDQHVRRERRHVGQAAGQRDHLGPRDHRHQVAHRRAAQALDPGRVAVAVGVEAGRHGDTIMIGRAFPWTCSSPSARVSASQWRPGSSPRRPSPSVPPPPTTASTPARSTSPRTVSSSPSPGSRPPIEVLADAVWPGAQAGAKLVRHAVGGGLAFEFVAGDQLPFVGLAVGALVALAVATACATCGPARSRPAATCAARR